MFGDRSILSDASSTAAFWAILGYMVLSNVGLVIGALVNYIKTNQKVKADINLAYARIRRIEKELELDSFEIEEKQN